MCGWCKDKYGLCWQIVPKQLGELMGDPDSEKSQRVMPSHAQDAEDYRRRPAKGV
jgi:predicted 3-demethylubiquinone-9 3-methyltransferase (glyoxalase superfamily)